MDEVTIHWVLGGLATVCMSLMGFIWVRIDRLEDHTQSWRNDMLNAHAEMKEKVDTSVPKVQMLHDQIQTLTKETRKQTDMLNSIVVHLATLAKTSTGKFAVKDIMKAGSKSEE